MRKRERGGEREGRKISLFLAIARETDGGGTVARRTRIYVYVYTYRIALSVPHYGNLCRVKFIYYIYVYIYMHVHIPAHLPETLLVELYVPCASSRIANFRNFSPDIPQIARPAIEPRLFSRVPSTLLPECTVFGALRARYARPRGEGITRRARIDAELRKR